MALQMDIPAPALKVQNWLRGSPLANFQLGKVYVVHFWATWRTPCATFMHGLMQLQEKYRDRGVEVVAVAADEMAAAADEVQAHVDAWLTENLPNLNFRVGLDCTGEVKKLWMEASFSFGIPFSFVVDGNGCIAFIGHPAQLAYVLPKALDGSWRTSDQAKAADRERIANGREEALKRSILDKFSAAIEMEDWKAALSAIKEGITLMPDSIQLRAARADTLLHKMRDMQTGLPVLRELVRDAIDRNAEDWLLEAMNQLFNAEYDYTGFPSVERFGMGKELSDHILALQGMEDDVRAYSYQLVARYYHESGNKARAEELLKLALKLVDGLHFADNIKQRWLAALLQSLANYTRQRVYCGSLWADPENDAMPKANSGHLRTGVTGGLAYAPGPDGSRKTEDGMAKRSPKAAFSESDERIRSRLRYRVYSAALSPFIEHPLRLKLKEKPTVFFRDAKHPALRFGRWLHRDDLPFDL
ncbi:redoxin domain-containing protein [Sinorhizobium meliloti]|nr:redoxin domain-containing protein [Sinorhizobium meliloti]MDW9850915.1 redoxin domain-containing protein [Sinorhizobium meliloti]MDX0147710.1 redoxin domain-containing protein [Sinorhizobium meliloti]MDX0153993.1 redoxin domain-containing protein [Sinorhizobium meliloti]MDX0172915.1 redoxin domain-containing protein [Sinorhizobium meliloti]